MNNVIKSQTVENMLTSISQENHKFCYTPAFQRLYQDLIVVILVYSLSILILILFYELV